MASDQTQYNHNSNNQNDPNKDNSSSSNRPTNQLSPPSEAGINSDDVTITGEICRNNDNNDQDQDAQFNLTPSNTNPSSSSSVKSSLNQVSYKHHRFTSMGQFGKPINDALILRHRRAGLFKTGSRVLELMGEDKIANNKLDLTHWSVPSSVRSTFMMAFSPNGQRVASTHGDHRIYICDLNTGQLIETLEGHPKSPWCFAWHPTDKDTLASGCLSGQVRVWDLKTKACELWTSENKTIITSISFHPCERILAIATANAVHFWDWFENEPFAMTKSPFEKERVKYVEFDSSGTRLVTGITNCTAISVNARETLQNRIIDSYLNSNGSNSQRGNMTQNSEILSQAHNYYHHQHHHHHNHHRRHNNNNNNNNNTRSTANSRRGDSDQANITPTITTTMSRIATLYKNLEALEESIRNNSAQQRQPEPTIDDTSNASPTSSTTTLPTPSTSMITRSVTANQNVASATSVNNQSIAGGSKTDRASRSREAKKSKIAPNTYEPLVVLFDELLESVQLRPIVMRGRTVDISTLLARNPVDLSNNQDYVVQFESINQVNQEFIRISKLMSSVRLYRQIIQQILSANSGSSHYQPNQFLTAQSIASSSHPNYAIAADHNQQRPMVLRSGPLPGTVRLLEEQDLQHQQQQQQHNEDEHEHDDIPRRPTDPILAIQFRNCARNVPLGSVCKLDLLNARSMCLVKSQKNLECSLADTLAVSQDRNSPLAGSSCARVLNSINLNDVLAKILETLMAKSQKSSTKLRNDANNSKNDQDNSHGNENEDENETRVVQPFYTLLNQLQRSLTNINQTPLTTSNVHTQIGTLRSLLDCLLGKFQSMIHVRADASRLVSLIHEITQNLTGRTWTSPLGRTLDELRMDVIHTFCIVDLTLHLARQMQLLQMQRISAIARARERGRQPATTATATATSTATSTATATATVTTTTTTTTTTTSTVPATAITTTPATSTEPGPPTSSTATTTSALKPAEIQPVASTSAAAAARDSESSQYTDKRDVPKKNPKTVVASCSFTTDSETRETANTNSSYTSNNHARSNNNTVNLPKTDNVNPPAKKRINERLPSSHSARKKSKIDTTSKHQMIDPSRQQQQQQTQRQHQHPRQQQQQQQQPQQRQDRSANNPASDSPDATSGVQRVYIGPASANNLHLLMRIIQGYQDINGGPSDAQEPRSVASSHHHNHNPHSHQRMSSTGIEIRRRASSHDNSNTLSLSPELRHPYPLFPPEQNQHQGSLIHSLDSFNRSARRRLLSRPVRGFDLLRNANANMGANPISNLDYWPSHQFHIIIPNIHPRGQNVLYMTLPSASSNYRLQCWPFSVAKIPNLQDDISNVVAQRCRIDTNASIDISRDGNLIACLVPQEDAGHPIHVTRYELRIISLLAADFGVCYHALPQDSQAMSVSLSPSARYCVVGLANGRQSIFGDINDDPEGMSIAKVYKLNEKNSSSHVRDIKIKRLGSLTLNSIKWMPRGIVYNVGQHPMNHHRHQPRRSYQV